MSVEKQTAAHALHMTQNAVMRAADAKAREQAKAQRKQKPAATTREVAEVAAGGIWGAASRGQSAELNGQAVGPIDAAGAQSAEMNQEMSYARAKELTSGGLGKADPSAYTQHPVIEPFDFDALDFDALTDAGLHAAEQPTAGQVRRKAAQPVQMNSAHVVDPGDSLWAIAEQVYGDGHAWTRIRDANPEVGDGHGLMPGQRLTIPLAERRRGAEEEKQGGSSGVGERHPAPSGSLQPSPLACTDWGVTTATPLRSVDLGRHPVPGGHVIATGELNGRLAVAPTFDTCTQFVGLSPKDIDHSFQSAGENVTAAFSISGESGEFAVESTVDTQFGLTRSQVSGDPLGYELGWSSGQTTFEYNGWTFSGTLSVDVRLDFVPDDDRPQSQSQTTGQFATVPIEPGFEWQWYHTLAAAGVGGVALADMALSP